MRVLVIEDDRRLANLIQKVLEEEHFGVDLAHDGDLGLEIALRAPMISPLSIGCSRGAMDHPSVGR